MSLKTRILALATSAALLVTPAASVAESVGYYAGELTPAVISESYVGGKQVNASLDFGVQTGSEPSEKMAALESLLEKCRLELSFYDDFGTGRVRANLTVDGVTVLKADALLYADGSVQAMTNLTGKYVLALPAGSFVDGQLNMNALGSDDYIDVVSDEFRALPAEERLRITANNMGTLILQHLLGWVSYMQMNSDGRLYTFDDTYLDATETRDGVAQRMIGSVQASEFIELFCNIANTINDQESEFQQAVADVLAEMGVTRWQARDVIDALFTEETIDPAEDYVQTTWAVKQGDPNALCEYDDVSYFFKKLVKSIDRVWDNDTENYLELIVSYDDYGKTVGVDAHLPVFSTVLPYEGDFVYSLKTDDNWQETHTAHGELQVYNDNRIIGDLAMVKGQDVDGVNESAFNGTLDVVNTVSGEKIGFAIGSVFTSTLDTTGLGETITSSADIDLHTGTQSARMISASLNAKTVSEGDGFRLTGTASVSLAQELGVIVNAEIASVEYDEEPFAGGQALDLTQMDEAAQNALTQEVTAQAATLAASFILHPGVLADLTRLLGE